MKNAVVSLAMLLVVMPLTLPILLPLALITHLWGWALGRVIQVWKA